MENFTTGIIIASLCLAVLLAISIIIFGGIEKIIERFPRIQNMLINFFDEN